MFTIVNEGMNVLETNYFESEHAQAGLFFLSWNAGAARLFVPDSYAGEIYEMQNCDQVLITRHTFHEIDCIEILFDDKSDDPYAVHIEQAMSDRDIPKSDNGKELVFKVYSSEGQEHECKAFYKVGRPTTSPI